MSDYMKVNLYGRGGKEGAGGGGGEKGVLKKKPF